MDKNITLYQITNVMAEKVFQKIDHFNKGRREDTGYYAISVSTPYRSYYALWLSLIHISEPTRPY